MTRRVGSTLWQHLGDGIEVEALRAGDGTLGAREALNQIDYIIYARD